MLIFQGDFINGDSLGLPQLSRATAHELRGNLLRLWRCAVAGYLRTPISTVVKLSLKVSHSENGPDFIFSVCLFFCETGWKKMKLTSAGWRPGWSSGTASVSRPPDGQLGTRLLKALASALARPVLLPLAGLHRHFALGKPSCASHAFSLE